MVYTAEERLKRLFCRTIKDRDDALLWLSQLREYIEKPSALEQFSLFILARFFPDRFVKVMEKRSLLIPIKARQIVKKGFTNIYKDLEKSIIDSEEFIKHLTLEDIVIFDEDMEVIMICKYFPAAHGYKSSLETSFVYNGVDKRSKNSKKLLLVTRKFKSLLEKKKDSIDFLIGSYTDPIVEKVAKKVIDSCFKIDNRIRIQIAVKHDSSS